MKFYNCMFKTLPNLFCAVDKRGKLAKEATRKDDISFNRIPKNEIKHQLKDQRIAKWQNQWDSTTKGLARKQFFPNIKDRLTNKIKLTPNFTAIVSVHGKTKAYLHRFEIIESPDCPCNGGEQTVEHLILIFVVPCIMLNSEINPTRCNNCVYSSQWLYSTCFG